MKEPASRAGESTKMSVGAAAVKGAWRRSDKRAVSLTLVVPGVVLSVAAVPLVVLEAYNGSRGGLGMDLLAAAAVSAGFGLGRRAAIRASGGIHDRPGLGWGAVIALISTVSIIPVFLGGPLLVFGMAILVTGFFQRNLILVGWAVFAGTIGIYNQIYFYPTLSEIWLHPALDLLVGLLSVASGLAVSRLRDWSCPGSVS